VLIYTVGTRPDIWQFKVDPSWHTRREVRKQARKDLRRFWREAHPPKRIERESTKVRTLDLS
jgi:hypothetical protein